MLEGDPPKASAAANSAVGDDQAETLHEISWSDLRARLEAARDLRETMLAAAARRLSSFDAYSAQLIAAQGDGKQPVNPDDLVNGKADGRMEVSSARTGIETGSPRGKK